MKSASEFMHRYGSRLPSMSTMMQEYAEYYHAEKMIEEAIKSIMDRLTHIETDIQALKCPEPEFREVEEVEEVEEEIRPQVGEVWESIRGEHFKITGIHLEDFRSCKLWGENIKNKSPERWHLSGRYYSFESLDDLVKKISDAQKPESTLPKAGEIWRDATGNLNLILKHLHELTTVDQQGFTGRHSIDGKFKDCEGYDRFDLVEKTNLTFADFLKLNKGEKE